MPEGLNGAERGVDKRPTLSLCMIVKNEEEYLAQCLESMKDVADEIIVVDTGSSDRTVEIARQYGGRVFFHAWTNDFSEARNASLDKATGDWIIYLDADEELVTGDGPVLRQLLEDPSKDGYFIQEQSFIGDQPGLEASCNVALRVFRNRPQFRFSGRLHEQISKEVQKVNPDIPISEVHINHYGYLNQPSISRDKVRRNLEILKLEEKERPNDPFVLFNLGVEYMRLNENEKALAANRRAYKYLPSVDFGYASILVRNIVIGLIELGRFDEAFKVLDDGEKVFTDYTDLLYLRGLLYMRLERHREAVEVFKRCLEKGESASRHIRNFGVGGFKALLSMASAFEKMGEDGEAVKHYVLAHKANPRLPAPIYRLGELLLKHDSPVAVKDYFQRTLDLDDAGTLMTVGSVFGASGHHDIALDFLRRACRLKPVPHVHFLIAEANLNRRCYAEAVAACRLVPKDSDYYEPSQLDAAFCLVLLGRVSEASDTLDQLPQDGELASFKSVYRAWMGRENHLDDQTREIAWDIVRKLLELQEYEHFEKALPLLTIAGATPGQVQLGLGKLYAKNGFAEMALEALILAFQSGELDAEGLAAAGQICDERGDLPEAAEFLREAMRLDPKRITHYTALARTLTKSGDYREAANVLRRARARFPHSELLKGSLQAIETLAKLA